MAKKSSVFQELMYLIDLCGESPMGPANEQRLFELDVECALECRKLGVPIFDGTRPPACELTPGLKLPFQRESSYKDAGFLVLGAPERPLSPESHSGIMMFPSEEWMLWMRAVAGLASGRKERSAPGRRATRLTGIEALTEELIEHLISARDHAQLAVQQSKAPELLPRPNQKELARRTGMEEYDVSRCLNDKSAIELRAYWNAALDIDAVLGWRPPRGGARRKKKA